MPGIQISFVTRFALKCSTDFSLVLRNKPPALRNISSDCRIKKFEVFDWIYLRSQSVNGNGNGADLSNQNLSFSSNSNLSFSAKLTRRRNVIKSCSSTESQDISRVRCHNRFSDGAISVILIYLVNFFVGLPPKARSN